MPRVCTVCGHKDRDTIDQALVAGQSARSLAAVYRVSPDAIERHNAAHLPKTLVKAQAAQEVAHADSLLSEMRRLQKITLGLLSRAVGADDLRMALGAIREARSNLELLAKLTGELDERAQVNLVISPEWVLVRAALLTALAPYAEARQAVAAALVSIEAAPVTGGA